VGLILNYRDWRRSELAIGSLLDEDIDAVVVWDNSEDRGDSAARLAAVLPTGAPVRIHVSPSNLGFAAGVNRGLELCASLYPGAWVLLINNDAKLARGALEILAKSLSDATASLIAYPAVAQGGAVRGTAYYHRATGLLSERPRAGCFAYASGCCMLLATDRLDLPLFDEAFFMYGEDAELGWRLRMRHDAMTFVDQVLVQHEGSASSGLGSMFYETHLVVAHMTLARKLASSRTEAIIFFILRVLMLTSRACMRATRFHSWIPLQALWQGGGIALRAAFPQKR
jgi:GT2 family glycosyltransferase